LVGIRVIGIIQLALFFGRAKVGIFRVLNKTPGGRGVPYTAFLPRARAAACSAYYASIVLIAKHLIKIEKEITTMKKLFAVMTLAVSFLAVSSAETMNPPACGNNCPWVRMNPPACGNNCPWVR
jgi:hypothetical protein